MTDDWGYDRDNQWGVRIEVIQKEHYYNYCLHVQQIVQLHKLYTSTL